MRHLRLLGCLWMLTTGSALAQPAGMAPTGEMTAQPLMVEDLPKGTVTVRVGRGSLADVAVDVEVRARLTAPDGTVTVLSEKTQPDGRATFSNLPVGSQFRAQAVVDGQPLQTATFAIPAQGGARLMLVSSAAPEPDSDRATTPPTMPPAQANPHGAGHGQRRAEPTVVMLLGQVLPKSQLPPGTVELRLLDSEGAPVDRQEVRLGRMVNVEQGVTWVEGVTDAKGIATYQRQEIDQAASYIAVVDREGLRLGSPLFPMPKDSGMAGELRIPGVTTDASVLRVSGESKILIDLREDKLEVMENLVIENTSDRIFKAKRGEIAIPLPAEVSGVEVIAGGSPLDTGPNGGLFLPPIIAPSQPTQTPVQARFGFYVQAAGEKHVTIRQPMPLGMEEAWLMIPASSGLRLNAPGLKALPAQDDDRGGKMLVFQLASVPRNGLLTLSVSGLPSRSPLGRIVAGVLSALLLLGAVLGVRRPKTASKTDHQRAALLAELVEVERARHQAPDPQLDDKRASLLEALVALDEEPHGEGK